MLPCLTTSVSATIPPTHVIRTSVALVASKAGVAEITRRINLTRFQRGTGFFLAWSIAPMSLHTSFPNVDALLLLTVGDKVEFGRLLV